MHARDVLQECLRWASPEGDVEEHFAGRDSFRTAARLVHELPNLLVAGPAKSQLIGGFSDQPADVGGIKRARGELVDLVPEPTRDARREETHAETVPK